MTDSTDNYPDDTLSAALQRYGIALTSEQIGALQLFCDRLWEWNNKLNLTRHTTYEKFVSRDVMDSFQMAQFIAPGERVLDVGTGGGVPGAVIAILRPDLQVWLCDSVGKKATAVSAIVQEAKVPVEVRHARAEQILETERFNTLVIRAVAPLAKLLQWFKPSWSHFQRLLVIKGPQWVAERLEARQKNLLAGLKLRKIAAYPLPGTHSESVVLEISPEATRDSATEKKTGKHGNK